MSYTFESWYEVIKQNVVPVSMIKMFQCMI
jgi:hypothetical protein